MLQVFFKLGPFNKNIDEFTFEIGYMWCDMFCNLGPFPLLEIVKNICGGVLVLVKLQADG